MFEELLRLLTDPAHLLFEVITDLAFAGVGAIFGRFFLRRHDRKHHDNGELASLDVLVHSLRMQQQQVDRRIEAHMRKHHR